MLAQRLQTRDIPGQHVTFEIHRYPDGKMTAMNIRPIGEEAAPHVVLHATVCCDIMRCRMDTC